MELNEKKNSLQINLKKEEKANNNVNMGSPSTRRAKKDLKETKSKKFQSSVKADHEIVHDQTQNFFQVDRCLLFHLKCYFPYLYFLCTRCILYFYVPFECEKFLSHQKNNKTNKHKTQQQKYKNKKIQNKTVDIPLQYLI